MTGKIRTLSRRAVLRAAGRVAIALPLLEAMACDPNTGGQPGRVRARAGGGSRPLRFISILVPNGTLHADWFPQPGQTDFTQGPILAALAPHQSELILLRGVNNPVADTGQVDGHQEGTVSFLTGWGHQPGGGAGGISLDQHIAAHIGSHSKRSSLVLGNENSGTLSAISYDAYKKPVPKYVHPLDVYSALFGDPSLDPQALAAVVARRKSVLDDVQSDYLALTKRVSGSDRQRLEAHLEALRDVERRLTIQANCEPMAANYPSTYERDNLPEWTRDMIDLLVLALACDLTRVATLVYRRPGGGESTFPWLDLGGEAQVMDHHGMTHSAHEYIPELRTIFAWFNEQTAYLLQRLRETPDLDGSLLDQVVLLQGSECSDGELHTKNDLPLLLAGRAGGQLETGRIVDAGGVPHNNLLVSLMNLMGLPGSTFGNPYFCEGPLEGLV